MARRLRDGSLVELEHGEAEPDEVLTRHRVASIPKECKICPDQTVAKLEQAIERVRAATDACARVQDTEAVAHYLEQALQNIEEARNGIVKIYLSSICRRGLSDEEP